MTTDKLCSYPTTCKRRTESKLHTLKPRSGLGSRLSATTNEVRSYPTQHADKEMNFKLYSQAKARTAGFRLVHSTCEKCMTNPIRRHLSAQTPKGILHEFEIGDSASSGSSNTFFSKLKHLAIVSFTNWSSTAVEQ